VKTERRQTGIGITPLDPRNRIRTCRVCREECARWLLRFEGEERVSHGIKICSACLEELAELVRARLGATSAIAQTTPPARVAPPVRRPHALDIRFVTGP
jgi:hypothetical protein